MWAGSAITGSGLPAPNGPARAIVATISLVAAAAVTAPSISSASSRRAASTADASASSRYARKALSASLRSVTPAAMAWPPPLIRSPSLTAWRTARPRSTPAIERPEPVPMPPGSSAMAKAGRPNRSLSRAATRPDHARMPAFGGGDDDGALVFDAERGHGFGFGLRHGGDLDHLTLAVEAVELGGEARALGRIVLQEQVDAERRAPDAAAGIDPRPQQKAEMPGLGRAAEPRDVHQRGEPGMIAPAQRHAVPWRRRRG